MTSEAPSARAPFPVARTVALLAGAVVLCALWTWNPAEGGPFPPCLFSMLTGLSCPACGGLRATHQLLHGDVRAAWALNPVYVALLPLAAAWVGVELVAPRRRRLRLPRQGVWIGLALLLLWGVLRNVLHV